MSTHDGDGILRSAVPFETRLDLPLSGEGSGTQASIIPGLVAMVGAYSVILGIQQYAGGNCSQISMFLGLATMSEAWIGKPLLDGHIGAQPSMVSGLAATTEDCSVALQTSLYEGGSNP